MLYLLAIYMLEHLYVSLIQVIIANLKVLKQNNWVKNEPPKICLKELKHI